jgi:polar amino acid transport system substrate-binding protein
MTKRSYISRGLAAGAILFVAASATPTKAAEDFGLLEPGVVSCAFSGSYAPFTMQNTSGEWDGLAVRVFTEMLNRLDLKYQPVITKWETLLVGLFADKYDMLCGTMDITKERQERVLFIDGWLESGGRLIVNKDSDIQETDQFKGKTMGVLVSSTWAELAKPLEPGETKYYQSENDALRDLANNKIDGVITDSIAAAWAIENTNLPLRIVPSYLSRIQKGWAAKQDRSALVKALNAKLAEIVADGTYAELTSDLIGYSPHPEKPISSFSE